MKKLLTILLLIMLAGQNSGYFHAMTHELRFIQETEEKGAKIGEDKNEKEYLSQSFFSRPEPDARRTFVLYSSDLSLSPLLDRHTPPPDLRF